LIDYHFKIEPSQKEAIFCNLKDIMNLSSLLLNDFETNILNRSFEHVKIGKCFLNNANSIRQIYAHYAQFIEYSNNILEKVILIKAKVKKNYSKIKIYS
jgi:hypothetical protein